MRKKLRHATFSPVGFKACGGHTYVCTLCPRHEATPLEILVTFVPVNSVHPLLYTTL
jgi:hypothetical protein